MTRIHTDLHAHSAFAGGARAGGKSKEEREKRIRKRFHDSALYSPLKGVTLLGTGDIQFQWWREFIEENFTEENGIYSYDKVDHIPDNKLVPNNHEYKVPDYILQSEYIFTGPVLDTEYKKRVHVLTMFPDFTSVDELLELFNKWEVSHEKMARPFIVCDTVEEVAQKMHAIADIHPDVELIPAHIMTPEGVYGGNNRINYLDDFFGSAKERINAVETGLSADPTILGMIPELDDLTLISNADAHSAKLNRIGREFTSFELSSYSYSDIIDAIRQNKVVKTAEFHPTEGRYFLTGHRTGRSRPGDHSKTEYCCFSPNNVPANDICPQCDSELTIGVLQRAVEISESQGPPRNIGDGPSRNFVTMVPLVEIVAHSIGMKTLTAKTVLREYSNVLDIIGTEVSLWIEDDTLEEVKQSDLRPEIIDNIMEVYHGNFSFFPGGYDGVYGELQIGETLDYEDIRIINN